jgi:transcriptional regulator with XRE-family HTH domain
MAEMTLGAAIARRRARKKLTQEDLAKRAKIHRVYLAKIETGAQEPTLKVLRRIAAALDTTVEKLV